MNRPYTSTSRVKDLWRPDRRTAMKVLVKKTYMFVDKLWTEYVEHNRADLRYIIYLYSAQIYNTSLHVYPIGCVLYTEVLYCTYMYMYVQSNLSI